MPLFLFHARLMRFSQFIKSDGARSEMIGRIACFSFERFSIPRRLRDFRRPRRLSLRVESCRAMKWPRGRCKLTHYCADCAAVTASSDLRHHAAIPLLIAVERTTDR